MNQAEITKWARDTFGEPAHTGLLVARLVEEFGELVAAHDALDNIAGECSDCGIFAVQIAQAEGIDLDAVDFFENGDADLSTLVHSFSSFVSDYLQNKSVRVSLPRFFQTLGEYLYTETGRGLREEMDRKMKINMNRQWAITADGIGQHIPQKGDKND